MPLYSIGGQRTICADRANQTIGSLPEQPRCEVSERTPPAQPLVRCAWRHKVHIVNSVLLERVREVLNVWPFHRTGREKQHLHFFIEFGRIGECAAAARLRIEGSSSEAAAVSAQTTEIGELVQVLQAGG